MQSLFNRNTVSALFAFKNPSRIVIFTSFFKYTLRNAVFTFISNPVVNNFNWISTFLLMLIYTYILPKNNILIFSRLVLHAKFHLNYILSQWGTFSCTTQPRNDLKKKKRSGTNSFIMEQVHFAHANQALHSQCLLFLFSFFVFKKKHDQVLG